MIREIHIDDIPDVLPLYISYYNEVQDWCWNDNTAGRRIYQVLSMEDSYGLIYEKDDQVVGFAMGFFKQYDDIDVLLFTKT